MDAGDTDQLASEITAAWYEDFFNDCSGTRRLGGEEYRVADVDEYKALGEDPDAQDIPLILVRVRDGVFFEVELDATVWVTSAEERQRAREQHERWVAQAQRHRPKPVEPSPEYL